MIGHLPRRYDIVLAEIGRTRHGRTGRYREQ